MNSIQLNKNFEKQGFTTPEPTSNPSIPHSEGMKETTPASNIEALPTFYPLVKDQLPRFLKDVVAHAESDQEADALLASAITVLSACFSNVYGIYDGRVVYPNLYFFLVGKASSGKGRIALCLKLVEKIQDYKENLAKLALEDYKREMRNYHASRETTTPPNNPPMISFTIPANSSKSVLYNILKSNDGIGLIFDTESDNASSNFNLEYGNYSSILREAYHNEPLSIARVKNLEIINIRTPRLSVVLSGTPDQIVSLIPSAENGLFSRFMFYQIDLKAVWRDVFRQTVSLDGHFKNLGEQIFGLYNDVQALKKVEFRLTPEQKNQFNSFFEDCQEECSFIFGDDIIASVRRMGLMAFRISMVLTILRILEDGEISNVQKCSDDDFNTALTMAKTILSHSARIYGLLPVRHVVSISNLEIEAKQQLFYDNLPNKFDRKTFISVAEQLGISLSTAERIIKYFCDSGSIVRYDRGHYQKLVAEQ